MGDKRNLSLDQVLESIKWQAKWFQETVHRIVASQDETFSTHKQIQWIDNFQATAMRQCEILDNRSNDVHVLNFALEDLKGRSHNKRKESERLIRRKIKRWSPRRHNRGFYEGSCEWWSIHENFSIWWKSTILSVIISILGLHMTSRNLKGIDLVVGDWVTI